MMRITSHRQGLFLLGAFLVLTLGTSLAGCTLQGETLPPGLQVEVVAKNLEIPWAMAFAQDGRLFLTERVGRVRVIRDGRLLPEPWATLQVAAIGEAGLLGVALDPEFPRTPFVYLYHTYQDPQGRLWNRVVRFREQGGRGVAPTMLLDRIPGASIHDGGRLKFGPDGKLYVTTGDAANPRLSQDLRSLAGKILRLNADGSIPTDNPFPGSPVYSYGHRNPQGLAWHPKTRRLYSTEHGPSGSDEVNVIQPGGNYGWGAEGRGGSPLIPPLLTSGFETWAPSGATFYGGNRLPWTGDLLFGALRGRHLHRVVLQAPDFTRVRSDEALFGGTFGRIREVVEGPDGFLYLATNNQDGRGSPASDDDGILRIAPGKS